MEEVEGDYVVLCEDTFPVKRELLKPKFRDRKKMASQSTSELEVPILLKGTQKWVTGLTKRTTCDDVIYALLYQEGLHEKVNTSTYAIFEKWREVERPLQGRTKIVKVWRTWGAEQSNVQFSMRRVDELEYNGEFSLTRKKKRSRHRTRERDSERERHHRHHSRNGGYCHNTSERLRSMETIVKQVISQERKLKDLIEHSDDTDKLIEKYESRLHSSEINQNGEDEKTHLGKGGDESMDDFFANVNVVELEKYVDYCDHIIALEDLIANEHSKIEDLSYQLHQCVNDSGSHGNTTPDYDDVSSVQVNLNRAVTCSIMQQYKSNDIQRELQFYDEKLKTKEQIYRQLQEELSDCEQSDSALNSSQGSVDFVDRSRALSNNESLKQSHVNNPLPLPPKPSIRSERPPPLPERTNQINSQENIMNNQKQDIPNYIDKQTTPERSPTLDPKPILKQTFSNGEYNNKYGFHDANKAHLNNEPPKVRFKTDALVDKYYWEESSLSEGISMDQSDCSDTRDPFEGIPKKDNYSLIKQGKADKPYLTVKVEDNDSNSDTGLSSMHSDDSAVYHLETLV